MIPYFDAHCDTAYECSRRGFSLRENPLHLDLRRLSAYGPCAQVFSICVDRGLGLTRRTERVLEFLLQELSENTALARLCGTPEDLDAAAAEGRVAVLISIEGAERLDCSEDKLRALYEKGLRIVHLTWNDDNALSGAAMDSGRGLTERGRAFVTAAQKLGVALDMSHISERGFWDVLETAKKPVLAGHSNAKSLCAHPRNLTDEQFTALVKTGGAAGLNFCRAFLGLGEDMNAIVSHAEHWLGLGGEKTVCLGGDLDGIPALPEGMTGVESLGELYNAMLRKNWSEDTVRDIFYNNLREFFGRAL